MAGFSMGSCGDGENPQESRKAMRDMFGPQAVDQAVRHAIFMCWMALPEGKKNVASVQAEIRRIVERALKDLEEDSQAFGISDE